MLSVTHEAERLLSIIARVRNPNHARSRPRERDIKWKLAHFIAHERVRCSHLNEHTMEIKCPPPHSVDDARRDSVVVEIHDIQTTNVELNNSNTTHDGISMIARISNKKKNFFPCLDTSHMRSDNKSVTK